MAVYSKTIQTYKKGRRKIAEIIESNVAPIAGGKYGEGSVCWDAVLNYCGMCANNLSSKEEAARLIESDLLRHFGTTFSIKQY